MNDTENSRTLRIAALIGLMILDVAAVFLFIINPSRLDTQLTDFLHMNVSAFIFFVLWYFYDMYHIHSSTKSNVKKLIGEWRDDFNDIFLRVEYIGNGQYSVTHNIPKHNREKNTSIVFFDKIYDGCIWNGRTSVFLIGHISDESISLMPEYPYDYKYGYITLYRYLTPPENS